MIDKLLLALRNGAHRVAVIQVEGDTRTQLGVRHPAEQDRRAEALRQWGIAPASPRQAPPATIDEPLPQRTQTILSYRLDPDLQRRLNAGQGMPSQARSAQRAPLEAEVRIDPDPDPL